MRRFPALLALAPFLILSACTSDSPPNVILVLVDTLRADRVEGVREAGELTPFLSSMAQRSFVFHNAYAQASWTNPSVASLFTSRRQSLHGVTSFRSVLGEDELTLAEVLREHGYTTAGFSANGLINRPGGFAQGFEKYRITLTSSKLPGVMRPSVSADVLNSQVLDWMDSAEAGKPFFLYVHYMDVHTPYDPPDTALAQVFGNRERPCPNLDLLNGAMVMGWPAESDEMEEDLQAFYDAAVIGLDRRLDELFSELGKRGALDDTLVIVTADHGEELQDHGRLGHGKTLYNETIHVPLLISHPGNSKRVDVYESVALIDLAPSILEWTGTAPISSFEGRSLGPAVERVRDGWDRPLRRLWYGSDATPRPVISELLRDPSVRPKQHQSAVVLGTEKIIVGLDETREYFDLEHDPHERGGVTLGAARRTALDILADEAAAQADGTVAEQRELDDATRQRMRALGYTD